MRALFFKVAKGQPFSLSENGVWLCDAVPARHLRVIEG